MKWIPDSLIFSHWILSEIKKVSQFFIAIFGNFPILQKNCLLLLFQSKIFFRKDAKSTRYFVYNHEGESCLIWTRFIYHLLYYVLTTENSVKQRGTYHDKIHRLDTSIINKVSLKTTDLQEQMNWDKLNNWVLERKTQIIGIDRLE